MKNKVIKSILLAALFISTILISGFSAVAIFNKYSGRKNISRLEAGGKVLNTVNTYFVPAKNAVLSGKVIEERGLYKVDLTLDKGTQSFHLTKDGAFLIFPNAMVDIAKLKAIAASAKSAENEEIPKADKPTVELFVMSLCPYGSRAEKEILPVVNLFTDRIDFKIKFIVGAGGDSISDFDSLHGIDEVKENARQAAVIKYYPDKFAAYVAKISEKSCVISCGEIKLDDYWRQAAGQLGMDAKKIESFAYGKEGLSLLKENGTDSQKYNVSASPTLIINGVKSKAIYKEAKDIKNVICSAFTNAPEVCLSDEETRMTTSRPLMFLFSGIPPRRKSQAGN